jgi:hypothetical protein
MSRNTLVTALVLVASGCAGLADDVQLLSAVKTGSSGSRLVQNLLAFSSNAVQPRISLVTGQGQQANAQALSALLGNNAAGCQGTTVTPQGSSVTADFGNGCALEGVTATGAVTFEVLGISPASARLTSNNLTINGQPLNGTVTFTARSADTMDVALDLHSGDLAEKGTVTVASNGEVPPTFTLDGTLATTQGPTSTQQKFNGVTWTVGDCYPSGGSVLVDDNVTLTFDAGSASTGKVNIQTNKALPSGSTTLPAYAGCGG